MLDKTKELNIPRRNCKKTKQEPEKAIKDTSIKYKETIFEADSPIFIRCLDELQKQQVFNEKVYDKKLMNDAIRKLACDELQKNIVINGDTMIDRRKGEVLQSSSKYFGTLQCFSIDPINHK